jgi:DNA-binding MarR family transcriptional regulator
MVKYTPIGVGKEHLGRLLLRAWRAVAQDGVTLVHERGHPDLRVGHLPLFGNIDADGTRITVLAERAGVTRQMMGRLVRELEELGYVSAVPDPADRRAVIVSLTERGWTFRRDADDASDQMVGRYVGAMGAARVRALEETLRRLIEVAGS